MSTTTVCILISIVVYLVGMLAIGGVYSKGNNTSGDFYLGGRKLGAFVVALAAGASDMSGWLLMGLPGAVYVDGISASWIAIGLIIGAYFNWRYVAARLRVYTERSGNALTLPDYFSNRFDDILVKRCVPKAIDIRWIFIICRFDFFRFI